ncbi:MAG TPA: hypothetical protein PLU50_07575, partial [Pseudobdellovibrionaceae bacterium]|nr:hypothetical protein [Pseudobdellovibrionaceae bacterium]
MQKHHHIMGLRNKYIYHTCYWFLILGLQFSIVSCSFRSTPEWMQKFSSSDESLKSLAQQYKEKYPELLDRYRALKQFNADRLAQNEENIYRFQSILLLGTIPPDTKPWVTAGRNFQLELDHRMDVYR